MSNNPVDPSAAQRHGFATDERILYICSDSVGETAEAVARATLRQFGGKKIRIKRVGHVREAEEVERLLAEAKEHGSFVAYTLVQPKLRETMVRESKRLGVRVVDIMGPMIQAFVDTFHDSPARKPGLLHEMDEQYFKRVEAIEFAVRYDDGRDPSGLPRAQVVLVGVSRTSKTPLSMFLAHKGFRVANWPLVPEVKLPDELLRLDPERVFGLTMQPEAIHKIRTERLRAVGLPEGAAYASVDRIRRELDYAASVMERIGCRVIDVSDKAIEETAGIIMGYFS
ncbi:pyruvate, water dikinase regulatory protein [Paenibacillus sp.]|uniref:pyruvate, water dikinase regulatory protein n=1 Tax=Paenibacillus sp. TaxID=58172 RepID=UPI002D3BF9E0|nr:pyruvate, water dikinase regulatory protein [Paenibacillus sp.]HZG83732.1 pyruvate, water dikinase regulatory protein [Paenibacillus sp.]